MGRRIRDISEEIVYFNESVSRWGTILFWETLKIYNETGETEVKNRSIGRHISEGKESQLRTISNSLRASVDAIKGISLLFQVPTKRRDKVFTKVYEEIKIENGWIIWKWTPEFKDVIDYLPEKYEYLDTIHNLLPELKKKGAVQMFDFISKYLSYMGEETCHILLSFEEINEILSNMKNNTELNIHNLYDKKILPLIKEINSTTNIYISHKLLKPTEPLISKGQGIYFMVEFNE